MVLRQVSALVAPARHQTALRGRALDLSRSTAVHGYCRRLRNLSVPLHRLLKSTGSIPKGGNGNPEASTEGIETLVCWGQLPVLRIGTVRHQLGERAVSAGRGASKVVALDPVTGAGANPTCNRVGSLPQRGERGRAPTGMPRSSRSPVLPQFGLQLPSPGRSLTLLACFSPSTDTPLSLKRFPLI